MNENQALNSDAIYAGMAWLREYAESSEGQKEFRACLEMQEAQLNKHLDTLREMADERGATYSLLPTIDISDELKEEIYPGEPLSVEAGIAFACNAIWGQPAMVNQILEGTHVEGTAIRKAMHRFIADRAN